MRKSNVDRWKSPNVRKSGRKESPREYTHLRMNVHEDTVKRESRERVD
jgi:hypothetical protein